VDGVANLAGYFVELLLGEAAEEAFAVALVGHDVGQIRREISRVPAQAFVRGAGEGRGWNGGGAMPFRGFREALALNELRERAAVVGTKFDKKVQKILLQD
jgi:hypothetical protein